MQTREQLLRIARVREVLDATCEKAGVTRRDLFGRDMAARTVRARHAAWEALRKEGFSYAQIGILFKREPSTVFRGLGGAAHAD